MTGNGVRGRLVETSRVLLWVFSLKTLVSQDLETFPSMVTTDTHDPPDPGRHWTMPPHDGPFPLLSPCQYFPLFDPLPQHTTLVWSLFEKALHLLVIDFEIECVDHASRPAELCARDSFFRPYSFCWVSSFSKLSRPVRVLARLYGRLSCAKSL